MKHHARIIIWKGDVPISTLKSLILWGILVSFSFVHCSSFYNIPCQCALPCINFFQFIIIMIFSLLLRVSSWSVSFSDGNLSLMLLCLSIFLSLAYRKNTIKDVVVSVVYIDFIIILSRYYPPPKSTILLSGIKGVHLWAYVCSGPIILSLVPSPYLNQVLHTSITPILSSETTMPLSSNETITPILSSYLFIIYLFTFFFLTGWSRSVKKKTALQESPVCKK